LGFAYAQIQRPAEAEGAALVGAGLAAQEAQEPEAAEQHLGQALPTLEDPLARTFVQAELGDVALARGEPTVAAERFQEALRIDAGLADSLAPDSNPTAAEAVEDIRLSVRQRYALALDDTGRGREACVQLRAAARAAQPLTETPEALLERCGVSAAARPAPVEGARAAEPAPMEAVGPVEPAPVAPRTLERAPTSPTLRPTP
jgi:tetratricopeptide (TPR) repeat protein